MQFMSQLEQGDWYIVASWLCVVSTLALYGIGIALVKMRQAVRRARAKRRTLAAVARVPRAHLRAVAAPRRGMGRARPANTAEPAPAEAAHWASVAAIVEAGLRGVETASALHASAGRQIDAAEYALNRLIADLAKVMPQPMPAEPLQPVRRPQPTAAIEPLAA